MPETLVGILSDSHGRADTTARAVAALRAAGASVVIHLGDLGSAAVIDELAGLDARIVFGNCDLDEAALARHAAACGVRVEHPAGELEVDGRRIAFTHGHLPDVVARALASAPQYLLVGHTHQCRDERVNGVRVVNPGALFRAAAYTAAVLDPSRDRLSILRVGRP